MSDVPAVAASQAALFAEALDLLVEKLAQDEAAIGVEFPYVTAADGRWLTMPASRSAGWEAGGWSHGNWFCGFWVGLLFAAHLHSGEQRFLGWARERMRLVAQRAGDPNTHDIGFIFWSSAVVGTQITGDAWFTALGLEAAARLRARLIITRAGAYLASWGPIDDPRARSASAIDTMANLPLLYWAAEAGGDASHRLAAEAHAATTAREMVRADRSTWHAVEYDVETGDRRRGYTFQGHGDDSCWSRGQAWALYGFAATAAATGKPEHRELAAELADHFLSRCDGSLVPAWDFDDPAADAPRDSSAAAIAAAGLLQLAALDPQMPRWRESALVMLESLARDYLAHDPAHRGLLRHGVYSRPHGIGEDSAVMFGDYYFVEALMRLIRPGAYVPAFGPGRGD